MDNSSQQPEKYNKYSTLQKYLKNYLSESKFKLTELYYSNSNFNTMELVFYIINTNYKMKISLSCSTFHEINEEYLHHLKKINDFIININNGTFSVLDLETEISNKNKESNKDNIIIDTLFDEYFKEEETDRYIVYNNSYKHMNILKKINFKDNEFKIGNNVLRNCNNCIIELLQFIKKITLCTYNTDYISKIESNIKNIDNDFNFDITNCCPSYYYYKEINLQEYESIYLKMKNIVKKFNNYDDDNNNSKYFPIFYCDDVDFVSVINNIAKIWCNSKGFEFNTKEITKYYIIIHIFECRPSNLYLISYMPSNLID